MRQKRFDSDALGHIAHIQFGPMYKQNDNVRMETDFIEIASHISKEYLDSNLFGLALESEQFSLLYEVVPYLHASLITAHTLSQS